MWTCFFSFGLLVLMISNCFCLTSSKPHLNLTTDESALIAFKKSILASKSTSYLLKNWSLTTPICGWIGVSCGNKHRRVTALSVSGYGLEGIIPPNLGNLTFLRFLDTSSNNFTCALPSELSKLRRLEYINIGANNFTGEIPSWFGALSQLQHIYLNENRFSGTIPSSLFNISRLQNLNMSFNILDGKIPPEIGTSSSLERVSLQRNRLNGSIPDAIFRISSLITINLGYNKLSESLCSWSCKSIISAAIFQGSIPNQIGNLTSLEVLNLESNNLTGSIPNQIGNLTSLRVLNLGVNMLMGGIPEQIWNLTSLKQLWLASNYFTDTIPNQIGNLISLDVLGLVSNQLTGSIPRSINNASQLKYLDLALNSFTGSIPNFSGLTQLVSLFLEGNNLVSATKELEFLSSLTSSRYLKLIGISGNPLNAVLPTSVGNLSQSFETLDTDEASLRGVIPSEIGNLTKFMYLVLSNSRLSGSIPTTIGNLKSLGRLELHNNQLQGSIPTDLCQMSMLAELDLSNNELEGLIPECMGEMQSLREIAFHTNRLSSTIPENFWNLKDLVFLILSSNSLSGQISTQIGNLMAVNQIDFSYNLLSGDIPTSIDGCRSLEKLNLSNNKLEESIPQSFGNMRGLSALDLSNNSLSGSIPRSLEELKVLDYFNVSNNRLEGEIPNGGVFTKITAQSFLHNSALCGAPRFEVQPCLDVHRRSTSTRSLMKYILPPLASVMVLMIIVVFLLRRRKHMQVPISLDTSLGISWKTISYIELSRATNSFSDTNLLGRGSFGSVFRGALSDGLDIAAKVFHLELEGGNKSFETESRILSTVRHRNLVGIIGCCTNTEFKSLILEFMPHGSLEKWLYSDNYCIDILQLLNISIDVSLALEYLHHGNTSPIVHCDIKPSNVLLDEDMTARIADFGIAKLFEEGKVMVQTNTLATIGYAAPEYGSEGKVSTSADVYSFGIMLLEMFTRKKPTDGMFNGEMNLKEWVSVELEANAMNQVLAPALLSETDRDFVVKEECVSSVFDLAMKCLAVLPNVRINMIEAATTLKKIKAKVVRGVTTTTRGQQHTNTIA